MTALGNGPSPAKAPRNVAQHLVDALAESKVTHIFAVPGSHGLAIFDAVADHPGITGIVARHEQSAAFMADGYARVSGRFGACVSSTGPGLLNSLTAMAAATGDGIPVLNVATCADSRLSGTGAGLVHEVGDQLTAAAEVSILALRVRGVGEFPSMFERAIRHLAQPVTGAVTLEVPKDVLADSVDAPARTPDGPRPLAAHEAIAEVKNLIRNGPRPVLWVGGRAGRAARHAVALLAEALDAPVFTTVPGKGAIDESDPRSLGILDADIAVQRELLADADPLILVGVDPVYQDAPPEAFPASGTVIAIDTQPYDGNPRWTPVQSLVGDLDDTCRRLAVACTGSHTPAKRRARRNAVQMVRSERRVRLQSVPQVEQLMETLREAIPPDAILVNDITAATYWAREMFPVDRTSGFLYPWRYAPLGYALPAAIGAYFAAPDRPVVALCGDGGFQFTAMELATIRQYDLPVICVILDNAGYGLIRERQLRYTGRSTMADLVNPDFAAQGRAHGITGMSASDPAELGRMLRSGICRGGPCVITLRLDVPHPTLV